jgi:hypothetical protein
MSTIYIVDCHGMKADIIFLVDDTGAAGLRNYQTVSTFMSSLVNAFDVGPNAVRVGAVLYHISVHTQFSLNEYNTKASVLHAIEGIHYYNSHSEGSTDNGINYVINHSFQGSYGDRPDAPNIIVLVTDGNPNNAIRISERLHSHHIQTTVVAIRSNDLHDHGIHNLQTVAGNNTVYVVDDYSQLLNYSLHDLVLHSMCGGKMLTYY